MITSAVSPSRMRLLRSAATVPMDNSSPVAFQHLGNVVQRRTSSATEASSLGAAARVVLLGETNPNTAVMRAHRSNEILGMVFSCELDWAHIKIKSDCSSITRRFWQPCQPLSIISPRIPKSSTCSAAANAAKPARPESRGIQRPIPALERCWSSKWADPPLRAAGLRRSGRGSQPAGTISGINPEGGAKRHD